MTNLMLYLYAHNYITQIINTLVQIVNFSNIITKDKKEEYE